MLILLLHFSWPEKHRVALGLDYGAFNTNRQLSIA